MSASSEPSLAATPATSGSAAGAGLVFGLIAYGWWGSAVPLYLWWYKGIVPAPELLAWRVVFGLPVLLALLAVTGRMGEFTAVLRSPRGLGLQAVAAALLAANWLTYIHAVTSGQATEAALGYYLNPLVNVALGALVLGERHGRLQWIAIACAAAGVTLETLHVGRLPWITLVLAFSFGFYGLVRKQAKAGPLPGLAIELAVMTPLALAGLGGLAAFGAGLHRPEDPVQAIGLLASGLMTIVPLLAFAAGARRLRLATMGMLQYLAPTGQLALAVWVFGEGFPPHRLKVFVLIWIAVALYSVAAFRSRPRPGARAAATGAPWGRAVRGTAARFRIPRARAGGRRNR